MTPAELALEASMHFEGQKCAYRQTKEGVVVSFVVHPNDVPKGLATAPLYTRYVVAVVQLGDDDQAVQQPEKEDIKTSDSVATPRHGPQASSAGAKRRWCDMLPSSQAFLLGKKPTFWAFLNEQKHYAVASEADAAEAVRELCGVKSRSQLDLDITAAGALWHELNNGFDLWELKERVGV